MTRYQKQAPSLFGLQNCNKDFNLKESWGKNQFNSTFPAALASYLGSKGEPANYLCLGTTKKIYASSLSINDLFGVDSESSDDLFFAFESTFTPYQPLVIGTAPRVDLVIQHLRGGVCLRGIEIKLTALPDNSTCDLPENKYGCEIVVRPDTIVYLACSLAISYSGNRSRLAAHMSDGCGAISDWSDANEVVPFLPKMRRTLSGILMDNTVNQQPLMMQPIWKTEGKSASLADHCLDVLRNLNFCMIRGH